MKKDSFRVGIDIGSYTTRIVVAQPTRTGMRVIAQGYSPTHGVRQGFIVHPEHVVESILRAKKMVEDAAQIKIEDARLAINGITLEANVVNTHITLDPSTEIVHPSHIFELQEKAKYLVEQKFNNRYVLQVSPIEFFVDDEIVMGNPEGMRGKKLQARILTFAARDHHISLLQKALADAGINVTMMIPGQLALAEAVLSEYQKMRGVLLVDIGAETVSTTAFEGGVPTSMHVFSIGGNDITGDIALGLQLPLDEAENTKRSGNRDDVPQKKLDMIIQARLEDIFELVQKYLGNIKKERALPAGVILSGGGSRMTSIADYARVTLKLHSQVSKIAHIANSRATSPVDHDFLLAFGLCSDKFDQIEDTSGDWGGFGIIKKIKKILHQIMP